MRSRAARAAGTAALLIGSVLAAAAAGEVAVRLIRPEYVAGGDPIANPFWRHDPLTGWSHRPGAVGVFSRPEFSHRVAINSAGWRDRDRSLEKPPGGYRILVLGDSFAWGHGVEDDRMVTRVLERLLPGVEVLNMGLSASATDQQLLILREHGLAYDPDLVLVLISRNDFQGNTRTLEGSYPKPMFVIDPGGALRLVNVPVPEVSRLARAHHRLRLRSGLLNLVESRLEGVRASGPGAAAPSRQAARDVTRALLLEMRAECARAGAAFAMSFVPSDGHTYPAAIARIEAERLALVDDLGAGAGIPVLDLVTPFREAARDPVTGDRVALHYRADRHWTAAGHELAARALALQLAQRRLVPVGGGG